ncbi:hypothetical protein AAG570_009417 [Ranatra chinensis]|uniref:Uncharacterized protein n=1 Tax=Ranatra chinensis TaxID=642074 RepID=A0ABD0YPK9_9HEMI
MFTSVVRRRPMGESEGGVWRVCGLKWRRERRGPPPRGRGPSGDEGDGRVLLGVSTARGRSATRPMAPTYSDAFLSRRTLASDCRRTQRPAPRRLTDAPLPCHRVTARPYARA